MIARPSITMTARWPMTWLFLHARIVSDYSGVATRHLLTRHRGVPWVLA